LPHLERQYISVQRHVSSYYYIKISEDCFVWAAPTLLRGGPYSINADNRLRGANTGEHERCGTTGDIYFQIFKFNGVNKALNREGVELPFNQSYRFEVTTNSLGKHYITS
jgi:hypothetical protein